MQEKGFLEYFDPRFKPREIQTIALNWLQERWPKEKVLAASLSCGAGKSLLGMAICKYNEDRGLTTAYITAQKSLQNQLSKEFTDVNMLKGAENYPCLLYPKDTKLSVDTSKSLDLCRSCKKRDECPYYVHKLRAYNECITIFNPMSYLFLKKQITANNEIKTIYEADTIILDECQSVSSMLCGAFDFKVWRHEYKYKKGISSSVPALVESLEEYKGKLDRLFSSDLKIDERLKIQRTLNKLEMVIKGLKKDSEKFVVEETEELLRKVKMDCLKVRVTEPPSWVLNWFFGRAKHIILMSGTLFKNTPRELGFSDYQYLDLPSPIPPNQRQFVPLACANNKFGNKNIISELGESILKIAEKHPNERGIVLASYDQAKSLKGFLGDNKRFLFHEKSDKAEAVNSFMSGKGENTIAVLSGSWEGLDAKDDLCRFIIITKCLFPNISDKVVIRKMDQDASWYGLETMKIIIQGANRATRHEKDFSVVYMLDSNFVRVYSQTKKYLPQYFIESIKWGKSLETI